MTGRDHQDQDGARTPGDRDRGDGERELLSRARAGDVQAFSRLVRDHQNTVYALVVRMVKDAATAEELTQDAFIKAFRSLGSFRGDARFSTWLYRIAVNLCHDHFASSGARRRRGEVSLHDEEGPIHDPPRSRESPHDDLLTREMAADFQECLEALDPAHREAFVLRHQEGLGYDEMAGVLGISRGNAKVRVHRAREAILRRLRERGHEV